MKYPETMSDPPGRTIARHVGAPSLWQELTPGQRQQLAQGLSELIQRMRRARVPSLMEINHE